jgi:hypothetical protein
MHPTTPAPLPLQTQGIGLQSSQQEIDAAMRATGLLRYSHEYLRDRDFVQHVLPLGISTMGDVHAFIDSLDGNHKKRAFRIGAGCTKAYVVRNWLQSRHRHCLPPLDWALTGLARARRTCCSCHETGSFHPSN